MTITETKLRETDKIKIRNFQIYRKDRQGRGGGVAILIRKNIPHTQLGSIDSAIENLAIQLQDGTILRTVYNRPCHKFTADELSALTQENRVLLIGDFNARHRRWNNKGDNKNGRTVLEYATDNGLVVVAPHDPTHYPRNHMTPSVIDIALNKNYSHDTQPTTLPLLNSDHYPVHMRLHNTAKPERTKQIYLYKKCNWTKYRQIMNREPVTIDIESPGDIDRAIDKLTADIKFARSKTTPLVNFRPTEETIPEDILNLIKFKNKIKRTWHRTRKQIDKLRLNDLETTIRQKIKDYRDKTWNDKIQNLSTSDNSLWKWTRLLARRFHPMNSLVVGGRVLMSNKEMAEAMADSLAETCSLPNNMTQTQTKIQQDTEQLPQRISIRPDRLQRLLTNPGEVKQMIKLLPNRKAPGPDDIPNILLKNVPTKTVVTITNIINAIFRLQYFPPSFKQAIIIPILKPQKSPLSTDSYRPIALLNTLSKLTEKIILERLNRIIQENGLLPRHQFGFRQGHSTTHALARLVQDITDGLNRKQVTSALSLDLTKAYDKTWHWGLIHKLLNTHRIPLHLTLLIKSYLTDRTFKTRVNDTLSDLRRIEVGVPQGTVLSPTLFNLYVADMPTWPTTKTLQYADDILIYASSFSAQTASQKLKTHVTKLDEYLDSWQLKINPQKTEQINFTRKITNNKIFSKIKIKETTITAQKTMKYLGVTLDSWLSFKQHITKTLNRTYATTTKLYPLLNRTSKLSTDNKLTIYKTILRPTVTYACPVWHNISNTQYKRLQTTQNKLLRLLTNANRYTNMDRLHRRHNLAKIKDYVKRNATKFYSTRLDSTDLTRTLTDIAPPRRIFKYVHEGLD